MRLWTLHPQMLDTKGLVALWREGLGAQKALLYFEQGRKIGYQNHPQLERFKATEDPLGHMVSYMWGIHRESIRRGYVFNASLLVDVPYDHITSMPVTSGQVEYEVEWLESKLALRSPQSLVNLETITLHPLFHEIDGGIEPWEKT